MSPYESNRAAKRRELLLSKIPDDGASVAQVAAALGMQIPSAEARLRLYAKAGHLFSARVSREPKKPAEAWYFRSKERRDQVQAACTKKAATKTGPKWSQARPASSEAASFNPRGIQPIRLPDNLDARFKVNISAGGFSSLPPGVYALPATSCAARAASEGVI